MEWLCVETKMDRWILVVYTKFCLYYKGKMWCKQQVAAENEIRQTGTHFSNLPFDELVSTVASVYSS